MPYQIDDLLKQARGIGASDLHVTTGIPPKCRLNGELIDIAHDPVMPADSKALVEQMIPGRLVDRFNEEGEVDFSYAIRGVGRYRVNIFKQRGTMAFVIRLVNTDIPTPESLGLPKSVKDLTTKKRGLVLVTGPTGSGKSTTLATLINEINQNYNRHIITLEDPIEYLHRHDKSIVNQREVGIDTQSYAGALRAALREDPDIILVGEMRDLDTIATAITAAETGHLVFSTLHTIGAVPTIDRIIDVFPTHQQAQIRLQIATLLEAVISQQLVPTLDHKGRVAAFELMYSNSAIRNLIREGKSHQIPSIIQTSKAEGMLMMDDALIDLCMRRQITKENALSYAQDRNYVSRRLV
ncbi:MAG: type IV pilus twitching motility protein PilT [Eubacterium sp.]|nr:type IV pilus twitching motility protein PilT [Eubacterium sp.]